MRSFFFLNISDAMHKCQSRCRHGGSAPLIKTNPAWIASMSVEDAQTSKSCCAAIHHHLVLQNESTNTFIFLWLGLSHLWLGPSTVMVEAHPAVFVTTKKKGH